MDKMFVSVVFLIASFALQPSRALTYNQEPESISASTETGATEGAPLLQEPPLYKVDVPEDEIRCGEYMVKVCHEECDPRTTPPPGVPCKRIKMCHCEPPK
jgi:hypothetical protein